jgi:argininosuccinate lyase
MPTKEQWKDAYALVGELVLTYTALDRQLNHIVIEVMHLSESPLLEAVVATLDPRQKIEMLKSRAAHIRQQDWKKAVKTHAERLERVAKIRNAACHTPMVPIFQAK